MSEKCARFEGEDVILHVLGTPGAKQDKILSIRGAELKIAVKAAAEAGKATQYMQKFLAKSFGVSKKEVELLRGLTSIHKQFKIHKPKKIPQLLETVLKKSE